jgi:KDO2-lipid IV(A) lauroyltransferase
MSSRFPRHLLAPRHWPTWLGAGLWYLLSQLPYCTQLWLAKLIAPLLKLNKKRYRMARINIELCFPHWTEAERQRVLDETVFSTAMAIFETGIAWFWPHWRLRRLYTVKGFEHLQAVQQSGQGALLLSMHFTHLDLGCCMLGQCVNYDGMYRPHKNPVYDYLQKVRREAYCRGGVTIPRDNARLLINRLREGRLVWYAPDRDLGTRMSMFVPFFGVQTATVSAAHKLLKIGQAQMLPFTQHRLANGKGYELTIHPVFENFPTDDEYQDVVRINQFIEQQVLKCPGQYFWAQPRFKSRPEGEASVYKCD